MRITFASIRDGVAFIAFFAGLIFFVANANSRCLVGVAVAVVSYWATSQSVKHKAEDERWNWKRERDSFEFFEKHFPRRGLNLEDGREGASRGDARSQSLLAHNYFYGQGGAEQDYKKAVKWARLAAERGHPDGQLIYAFCLAEGLGTDMDDVGAQQWRSVAAIGGNAVAQFMLGREHDRTPSDCLKWCLIASESGDNQVAEAARIRADALKTELSPGEITASEGAARVWKALREFYKTPEYAAAQAAKTQ